MGKVVLVCRLFNAPTREMPLAFIQPEIIPIVSQLPAIILSDVFVKRLAFAPGQGHTISAAALSECGDRQYDEQSISSHGFSRAGDFVAKLFPSKGRSYADGRHSKRSHAGVNAIQRIVLPY